MEDGLSGGFTGILEEINSLEVQRFFECESDFLRYFDHLGQDMMGCVEEILVMIFRDDECMAGCSGGSI